MQFDEIAIIGAGLSGLSLAVFLKQQHNIQSTVYELRAPGNVAVAGALMLSPNALRSLDAIGLCDRIRSKGWHFRKGSFRKNNDQDEFIAAHEFGSADKYGYDGLRIYRQVLIDELRAMVKEAGIEIVYGKRFSRVISESEEDSKVTFAFEDGEQRQAGILTGADGIRSAVRNHISNVALTFGNVMTIVSAIPTAQVEFPYKYDLPMGVVSEAGGFALAQQNADGSELMIAMQVRTHERDWKVLNQDKQHILKFVTDSYDSWNPTIKSAIDAIRPDETLFIWPFYSVPRLPRWSSTHGRVVLLGDAAHAIPPAAGQGANQAFEDVHSISLLIAAARDPSANVDWKQCINWWQEYRQNRTDKATELTIEMTRRRLPGWEGGDDIDNEWLFNVQIEQDVEAWLSSQNLA